VPENKIGELGEILFFLLRNRKKREMAKKGGRKKSKERRRIKKGMFVGGFSRSLKKGRSGVWGYPHGGMGYGGGRMPRGRVMGATPMIVSKPMDAHAAMPAGTKEGILMGPTTMTSTMRGIPSYRGRGVKHRRPV